MTDRCGKFRKTPTITNKVLADQSYEFRMNFLHRRPKKCSIDVIINGNICHIVLKTHI